MQKERIETIFKWNFYLSIVFIMALSALNHFLYELLPVGVIAVFAPVSESIAEHLKIVFYPILLWWCLTFVFFKKSKGLLPSKWFSGAFTSAFLSICLLTTLCSTLFFALGATKDSLVLHILIEVVTIFVSQWTGYHVYKYSKGRVGVLVALGVISAVSAILMAAFTFGVPNAPLFFAP
ncbi:MAG: hypothetical protein IJ033_02770 [Clostridia bacterium]|nr:hypothetical protein [Clostridia bacterium]